MAPSWASILKLFSRKAILISRDVTFASLCIGLLIRELVMYHHVTDAVIASGELSFDLKIHSCLYLFRIINNCDTCRLLSFHRRYKDTMSLLVDNALQLSILIYFVVV